MTTDDQTTNRSPYYDVLTMRVVGGLVLLWYLVLARDYLAYQTQRWEPFGQAPVLGAAQQAYLSGLPTWVDAAWAVGVGGGLLGLIGLLLLRRWAVWLFVASLVGLALSNVYYFGLSSGGQIMGCVPTIFNGFFWVLTIWLILVAREAAQKGVLS